MSIFQPKPKKKMPFSRFLPFFAHSVPFFAAEVRDRQEEKETWKKIAMVGVGEIDERIPCSPAKTENERRASDGVCLSCHCAWSVRGGKVASLRGRRKSSTASLLNQLASSLEMPLY